MGRKLGAVADEARDVILLIDSRTGRICDANRPALDVYGYDYETLLTLQIPDLRAPHTLGDLPMLLERARLGGAQFETVHRRKDGSQFPCEISTRIMELDGESYFLSIVRDLSDRKQAESTLRQTERLLSKVFHASPLVVSIIELESNRYIDVNDSFLRTLELTRAQVIGRTFGELGLRLERAQLERMAQAVASRFEGEFEMRIVTRSGREIDTIHSLEFIELDGRPCVVAFAHDMTEHKRLEQQLRHAQKMEAVGRLAGGVAHDFNNILTAIRGHAELLLQTLEKGAPQRRQAEQIHRSVLRAAALTGQLLAFSRKQALQPRTLDLNVLVANLTAMLSRLIGEDVELTTELQPGIGSVRADPGQIEQVLVNLVVNARDAMPEGGVLVIRTENVEVGGERAGELGVPTGRWVLLEVRDSGVGIDPAIRGRLFEPFFSTKEHGRGTGLGLSTVYGIVTQSGGHINLESALGQGSTFRVWLPRVDELASLGAPTAPETTAPRGHETVLLVEDDSDVRTFVQDVLRSQGYSVLAAVDGPHALKLVEQHDGPIDLLVTDVVMPRMMGSEVAARVTALRPGIRVLYISGYPGDTIVRQGATSTEESFVQKPFSVVDLARRVRSLLDARAP